MLCRLVPKAGTDIEQALCFESALKNQTACAPTDVPCICHNQPLNLAIQGCMMGSCTLKESLCKSCFLPLAPQTAALVRFYIRLTFVSAAINTTYAMCGIPIKDRSSHLIITNAVFGGLALIALLIRMQVSIQQHIFGLDDFSAVIAYLFAAPVTFGQLYCGLLGFGKDTWAVPPENIYKIMKVGT